MKALLFIIMCLVLPFSIVNANQDCQPKQSKKSLISNTEVKHSLEEEMRMLSNKVENNLKEQRKKQNEELVLWRSQADEKGTTRFIIASFSYLILLITLFIPAYLWKYKKLLPEITNAKLIIESWKDLSLLLTEIQLSIMREYLENDPASYSEVDNEPIQYYISSLDTTRALQRLTSEDYSVVKNGYDKLGQIWDQRRQQSKSKIRLFICKVLSSGVVVHPKNKKLLEKLLRHVNDHE